MISRQEREEGKGVVILGCSLGKKERKVGVNMHSGII
jgi:hypothetical protein